MVAITVTKKHSHALNELFVIIIYTDSQWKRITTFSWIFVYSQQILLLQTLLIQDLTESRFIWPLSDHNLHPSEFRIRRSRIMSFSFFVIGVENSGSNIDHKWKLYKALTKYSIRYGKHDSYDTFSPSRTTAVTMNSGGWTVTNGYGKQRRLQPLKNDKTCSLQPHNWCCEWYDIYDKCLIQRVHLLHQFRIESPIASQGPFSNIADVKFCFERHCLNSRNAVLSGIRISFLHPRRNVSSDVTRMSDGSNSVKYQTFLYVTSRQRVISIIYQRY